MAVTLRQSLLPLLQRARSIAPALGMHLHGVTIVTRTWAADKIGVPNPAGPPDFVDAPTPILHVGQPPHVEQLSLREIASSGGTYRDGDIRVGPITPFDSVTNPAGFSGAQLRPVLTQGVGGVEVLYVVTGPLAGEYALVELRADRPLHLLLVLRRRRTTP